MLNTNPTAADIDATMNLLSVLEMANDATRLKAALQEIKDAQDAVASDRAKAEAAVAEAEGKSQELQTLASKLDAERLRLKEEEKRIFKNNEDVEASRVAMVDERNNFDAWMAAQREALAADKAKVESDAVANQRAVEDFQATVNESKSRLREADAVIKSAEAKRQEYEAKLAGLKAMVN